MLPLTRTLLAATLLLGIFLQPVTHAAAPAAIEHSPLEDLSLQQLLVARLELMRSVAAWKWLNALPIEDLEREQLVIQEAVLEGLSYRLEKNAVERFYRAQITAAKAIQQYWFETWRKGNAPLTAPNLQSDIRPQLLALGRAIAQSWGQHEELPSADALATALSGVKGLPRHSTQTLTQALLARAFYDDALTQIQQTGLLRVGTTGDYRPFSYQSHEDKNGKVTGIDITLANSLANYLGAKPVFVLTGWPTLMDDYAANQFDVALSGVSITEARLAVAAFSAPYFYGGKGAISRCEDAERFHQLTDIDQAGVRVIVNPGGTNAQFVKANIHAASVIIHADNRTIFHRIIAGDADVMITDLVEVQLQSQENPELCAAIDQPLNEQNKGVLTQRSEGLIRRINNWLASDKTQALLDALFKDAGLVRRGIPLP